MGFNEEYNRMSFLVIISVAGRKILGAGKPHLNGGFSIAILTTGG